MFWTKKNDIKKLVQKQRIFDDYICKKHNVEYDLQMNRLALQVEINELCAETKIFKYWSVDFNKINREDALEEYADCLHFIFSLMSHEEDMRLSCTFEEFYDFCEEITSKYKKENTNLITLFTKASKYSAYKDTKSLLKILCVIGQYMNFTSDEIMVYYHFKADKNYQRQTVNY